CKAHSRAECRGNSLRFSIGFRRARGKSVTLLTIVGDRVTTALRGRSALLYRAPLRFGARSKRSDDPDEAAHETGETMTRASIPHPRPASSRAWRPPVLRGHHGGERHATWLEVFFDLCFVAAVAALTHDLRTHPSLEGLLRFGGLFVPVWWAWTSYSWYATGFDNDD